MLTIHQLMRYLEHYIKVPSWTAYDARMTDINLDSMSFSCGGKTHRIPLDPPMNSYRDARERAVQMDKESLAGLKRSDITVNEFLPPKGLYLAGFLIVATTFLAYSQRWWFAEGAVVERVLGPGFARFSWTIQPYLIAFMLVVHSAEAAYFIPNRLVKHSVNPRSVIFWQWLGTTFIEGVGSFNRFDKYIARKQEEKAKLKH